MHRLLAELEGIIDVSYRLRGETIGDLLAALLERARLSEPPQWGADTVETDTHSLRRECMQFYYRPNLHPDTTDLLRLAHKLQFHLLPTHCPQQAPVTISTVLESFAHLSGDLLGWRFLDDGFLFWLTDICGHGIRAGLLAAVLKTILDRIDCDESAASFVDELNRRFCEVVTVKNELYYVTGVFVALRNGASSYVSAGHPSVFQKRKGYSARGMVSTDVPIGLYTDRSYAGLELEVQRDDLFYLYSDGVTEATNREGEEFGIQRLRAALAVDHEYPDEMNRAVYHRLSRFRCADCIDDDVAMLTARVK